MIIRLDNKAELSQILSHNALLLRPGGMFFFSSPLTRTISSDFLAISSDPIHTHGWRETYNKFCTVSELLFRLTPLGQHSQGKTFVIELSRNFFSQFWVVIEKSVIRFSGAAATHWWTERTDCWVAPGNQTTKRKQTRRSSDLTGSFGIAGSFESRQRGSCRT